jgi:hypothetical protein
MAEKQHKSASKLVSCAQCKGKNREGSDVVEHSKDCKFHPQKTIRLRNRNIKISWSSPNGEQFMKVFKAG